MEKDKKFLKPVFAALGAMALMVSASVFFGNKEKPAEDAGTPGGNGDDQIASSDAIASDLTIDANRCRGCGKCVRIDPEHFALDVENREAIVISTDNLSAESLQLAANNCEGGAIIIS